MSPEPSDGSPPHRRFDIGDLRAEQLALLATVLETGDVPHAISQGQLIAAAAHLGDVERAIAWVRAGNPAEDFDDPEYRSDRPPVVRPSRPPLADGRREATRWRRLGGGVIDHAVILAPAWRATRAGVPLWATLPVLVALCVLPMSAAGWSVGKHVVRTRAVRRGTLGAPGPVFGAARWLLSASPFLLAMTVGWTDAVLTLVWMAIHAPIVIARRGAHDYLADTIVVEAER